MLTEEGLRALLRFTLKTVGPADLRELVKALTEFFPDLPPATIHDSLNNLLASGVLSLSKDGIYYDSQTAAAEVAAMKKTEPKSTWPPFNPDPITWKELQKDKGVK